MYVCMYVGDFTEICQSFIELRKTLRVFFPVVYRFPERNDGFLHDKPFVRVSESCNRVDGLMSGCVVEDVCKFSCFSQVCMCVYLG